MKKILIALAILASVQVADAQVKTSAAAKSAVEAAEEASQNPKRNTKVATWTKLAQSYMDAYNSPMGNGWVGASRQELQLIMGSEKPLSSEQVEISGEVYVKDAYETRNYYFNANGILAMIEVVKPVFDYDVLEKASEAFAKAYEVDTKKTKIKDISEGLKLVAQKYQELAYNEYTMGDLEKASVSFENAAKTAAKEPLAMVDTLNIYNAGFTALQSGNAERALNFFSKCKEVGYYNEDGEVFSKIADCYTKLGQPEKSAEVLEEGFSKFPQSQSILIGLINYYLESNSNTSRLFALLDEAKKNEPNNASLYYVEGNIHSQIGDVYQGEGKEEEALAEKEAAVKAYYKASEINPDYEFGYIGAGILYYNLALVYQDKAANEYDDAKYMALVEKFESSLEKAIDPFEKAFSISKDPQVQVSLAEYLKNIYYRFSSKSADYEAAYNKYNDFVKNAQ